MQTRHGGVLRNFIVLEGIDGTGTTTQMERLGDELAKAGLPVWTSFEPTDLPTGVFVRKVLSGEIHALPGTIARLFAADRYEHLHGRGGAIERIEHGELVIFDRYFFSSLAYQGMDCGMEVPLGLNADFPLPEILLYFELDVEIAMSRVARRPGRDIYETHEALVRVEKAYDAAIDHFADSGMLTVRLDASLPIVEVSRLVDEAIAPIVERFRSHS